MLIRLIKLSFGYRTQSTAVLRVAILPRLHHRTAATKGVCVTLPMVTLTVQPAAWEWVWGRTGTAHEIIHPPSQLTRRREKIETINYPPLGTSIPVNNVCSPLSCLHLAQKELLHTTK